MHTLNRKREGIEGLGFLSDLELEWPPPPTREYIFTITIDSDFNIKIRMNF